MSETGAISNLPKVLQDIIEGTEGEMTLEHIPVALPHHRRARVWTGLIAAKKERHIRNENKYQGHPFFILKHA